MKIFVLLYNSNSENEVIHSIEYKSKTIVLMFEDKDDAERYCGLLEAQDFPVPSVESIEINEIEEFCKQCDYETHCLQNSSISLISIGSTEGTGKSCASSKPQYLSASSLSSNMSTIVLPLYSMECMPSFSELEL